MYQKNDENRNIQQVANCHRVNKLDCIGHVQKRMGKNLIALSGKSKLSDGKPVGGKAGRLTRPTIDKLQKYYGNAIRRCVDGKAKTNQEVENAVKKMQSAIKAVLYHSVKIANEKKRYIIHFSGFHEEKNII